MLRTIIFCIFLALTSTFDGGGLLFRTLPRFRIERAPHRVANMAVRSKSRKKVKNEFVKKNKKITVLEISKRLNSFTLSESDDFSKFFRILRMREWSDELLLDLLIKLKDSKLPRKVDTALVLEQFQSETVPFQTAHYNELISVCSQPRRWREAQEIFEQMGRNNVERNATTYNTLLSVLARCGRWKPATTTMELMRKDGVTPDAITFSTLISACERDGEWFFAVKLLKSMRESELPVDTNVYSSCITACQRAGQWERALKLLVDMENHFIKIDVTVLNAAIGACANAGKWHNAERLFKSEMPRHGVEPNAISYNALISAYANAMPTPEWEKALQALDTMESSGFTPNTDSFNSVLKALRRGGQLPKALELLEKMEDSGGELTPDLTSYTETISACAEDADWETAQRLLQRMEDAQVEPQAFTYSQVMASLLKGEKFLECLNMFETVSNKGLRHHTETLNLMLEAAHKGGHVEEGLALALPVLDRFRKQNYNDVNRETLEHLKRLLKMYGTPDGFGRHFSAIEERVRVFEKLEISRLKTDAERNAQLDAEDSTRVVTDSQLAALDEQFRLAESRLKSEAGRNDQVDAEDDAQVNAEDDDAGVNWKNLQFMNDGSAVEELEIVADVGDIMQRLKRQQH